MAAKDIPGLLTEHRRLWLDLLRAETAEAEAMTRLDNAKRCRLGCLQEVLDSAASLQSLEVGNSIIEGVKSKAIAYYKRGRRGE